MFIIYSKNNCAYCTSAKMLLEKHGITYQEKNIEKEKDAINELMAQVPNARTMPQIFKENTHIGGFQELEVYLTNNKQ